MHFAAKNLLYQIHQSLDTQHVTVAAFKRYARSPETRTFKKYFRRIGPGHLFTPYMRQRPQYSLSRYISLHKRKKNPILTNFTTRITNTLMEKLHELSPCKGGVSQSDEGIWNPLCPLWTKKTQNKPILETGIRPLNLHQRSAYEDFIDVPQGTNKPKQTQSKPIDTKCHPGLRSEVQGDNVWMPDQCPPMTNESYVFSNFQQRSALGSFTR